MISTVSPPPSTGRATSAWDVLVTLGGASVGDHDLIQAALVRAGMDLSFWKIAMRARQAADARPDRLHAGDRAPRKSRIVHRVRNACSSDHSCAPFAGMPGPEPIRPSPRCSRPISPPTMPGRITCGVRCAFRTAAAFRKRVRTERRIRPCCASLPVQAASSCGRRMRRPRRPAARAGSFGWIAFPA